MDGKSLDITEEKINHLKEIIPEAFTEGKIDWEKLKAALGEDIEFKNERYVLNWAGKSDAFRVLQAPTTATLVPCKEESVNFEDTEHIFIEGENLEVLKVLQKSYFGKIKMIYIDPPYNTGNDKFIYPDKFSETKEEYLSRVGDKDESGYMTREGLFRTNSKDSGHYHSNWLSMMYPRLFLARNLLREDGVIFVSIDDNEVHNLRLMMNEIFGEENFICTLVWNKQHSQQQGLFKKYHEYVLLYAKNEKTQKNIRGGEGIIDAGALKRISRGNPASEFEFPAGVRFDAPDGTCIEGTFGDSEKVTVVSGVLKAINGKTAEPVVLSAGWTQKEQMIKYFRGEEVIDTKGQRVLEFYFNSSGKLKCLKERSKITPPTILPEYGMVSEQTAHISSLFSKPVFDNPKPVNMLRDFISWFAEEGDIVLDFFAGSCTLCESIFYSKSVPSFIVVQLPEKIDETTVSGKNAISLGYSNIAEIGKERIRRVIKKIKAEPQSKLDIDDTAGKQDLGFKVFKLQRSNFKIWRSDVNNEEELVTQLEKFTDPVDENAKIENILYELLLKSGAPLTAKIEEREGYYLANNGEISLILKKVDESIIKAVISEKPQKVITLDRLFKDNDQLKTNSALQMKDAEIDFRIV